MQESTLGFVWWGEPVLQEVGEGTEAGAKHSDCGAVKSPLENPE